MFSDSRDAKRDPASEEAGLSFEAFLADNRLTLLGIYFVAQACGRPPRLVLPWPHSNSDDQALNNLVSVLERLMPRDGFIADLRDWDVRLYDLMADEWFFGAAFGPESEVESLADELAGAFMEQVAKIDLDYDQFSDPDGFREVVDDHALAFIKSWRERLYSAGSGQTSGRSEQAG